MEHYQTIQGTAQGSLEEKKSTFLSQIAFVDTEERALAFLNDVRAQHRTANHHVYAYVLREGARVRYSDDGEPAKTSGLPTLESIQHAGLTDVIVVTTRYFGGTLLGTGGLVRAYTQAAKNAIASAKIVTISVCVQGSVRVPYPQYEATVRVLEDCGAKLGQVEYSDAVSIPFLLLAQGQDLLIEKLNELCRGQADYTLSSPYHAPF